MLRYDAAEKVCLRLIFLSLKPLKKIQLKDKNIIL